MAHPIVAIKVETKRGNTVISTITQSPRGTRVLLDSVSVPKGTEGQAAHKAAVSAAVTKLVNRSE